jgi:transposase
VNERLNDAEWLREMYERQHRTHDEIAAMVGVTKPTVIAAMRRHGIAGRTAAESRRLRGSRSGYAKRHAELSDEAWLRQRYETDLGTVTEMAAELGCSAATILDALKAFGIPTRTPAETRTLRGMASGPASAFPQLADRAWLAEQYHGLGKPITRIAEELGCSHALVLKAMRRHGLASRPLGSELKGKKANNSTRPDGAPGVYHSGYTSVYRDGKRGVEHRRVAEAALGEPLRPGEHVHHLNLKRADNRPENLIVLRDNRAHRLFHLYPPAWVPRCPCCGHPQPETLEGRPDGVPMRSDWP